MKILICLVILVLVSACATPVVSESGRLVKTGKADPASNCEELGVVHWNNQKNWTKLSSNEIRAKLRNDVSELGGNYMRIDTTDFYTETGTAFRCPASK